MKKKLIIIAVAILLIFGAVMIYIAYTSDNVSNKTNVIEPTVEPVKPVQTDYSKYNQNIVSTQLQKDSIAPIDAPDYISIKEADKFLNDKDKVFVLETTDSVYIYPQKILVWHEIVNDSIDGEALSVTYCPLTGSAICYLGDVSGHTENTYGTSGKLLNSNLLMYDRDTDSYIPQILGTGINNDLEGIVLKTNPIHWADWKDAKAVYTNAYVLSNETGFQRDYFLDPYGSYEFDYESSYYQNDGIMFPLMNENDGTYSPKKVVVGVKHQDYVLALDPLLVEKENIVHFAIGDMKAVAFYDEKLKAVRVYDSRQFQSSCKPPEWCKIKIP